MSKEKRVDWTVLGRVIGTATGWDQVDTFVMMLYDFEPAVDVDLPTGDINIDFENGVVETFDDAGKVTSSKDIVLALFDVMKEVA
jgi:hypothetical protein